MSTQMWSSFPVTSHFFMSYLVLLSFPHESLGLNLKANQEASLSSPLDNFCLYSPQPLFSLPIHLWGHRPCFQTMSPVLFLSVQSLLPCPKASITSGADVLLTPALPECSSSLPTAPQQTPVSLSYFCPFLQPVILSSRLHHGFCSLPAVAKGPPVPHPQPSLVPHLCSQSLLLSPLPGTARAAGERLFEPLELHSRTERAVFPTLICQVW